ncbi:MAG: hypothetical protein ABH858_03130, partial [Candidatus Omnitrophota bacterium]
IESGYREPHQTNIHKSCAWIREQIKSSSPVKMTDDEIRRHLVRIAGELRQLRLEEQDVESCLDKIRQALESGRYWIANPPVKIPVLGDKSGRPLRRLTQDDLAIHHSFVGYLDYVTVHQCSFCFLVVDAFVFSPDRHEVILIRRAFEPSALALSTPGGVVTTNSPEDEVRQELKDELRLRQVPQGPLYFVKYYLVSEGTKYFKNAIYFYTLSSKEYSDVLAAKDYFDGLKRTKERAEFIVFIDEKWQAQRGLFEIWGIYPIDTYTFLTPVRRAEQIGLIMQEPFTDSDEPEFVCYDPENLRKGLEDASFLAALNRYLKRGGYSSLTQRSAEGLTVKEASVSSVTSNFEEAEKLYKNAQRQVVDKGLDGAAVFDNTNKYFKQEGKVMRPDPEIYEPTGVVLGRPLPEAIESEVSQFIDKVLIPGLGHSDENQTIGFIPLNTVHATIVNYTHFSDKRFRGGEGGSAAALSVYKITDGQADPQAVDVARGIVAKYGPVTILLKGILIVGNGAILIKGYLVDGDLFGLKEELSKEVPDITTYHPPRWWLHFQLGRIIDHNVASEVVVAFNAEYGEHVFGQETFLGATLSDGKKLPFKTNNRAGGGDGSSAVSPERDLLELLLAREKTFCQLRRMPIDDLLFLGNMDSSVFEKALQFIKHDIVNRVVISAGFGRYTIPLVDKAIELGFTIRVNGGTVLTDAQAWRAIKEKSTDKRYLWKIVRSESFIISQYLSQMAGNDEDLQRKLL